MTTFKAGDRVRITAENAPDEIAIVVRDASDSAAAMLVRAMGRYDDDEHGPLRR